MDRSIFLGYFTEKHSPPWRCPACDGHLRLAKENLLYRQTAMSAAEQKESFSEFEWIKAKGAAMFVCSSCNESVACAADGWVEEVYFDEEYGGKGRDWEYRFRPSYFDPPLLLLDVPPGCPEEVTGHLHTSFSMYFCNPGAAANAARIALEALMDHWAVPSTTPDGNYLSLHRRLDKLPAPFDTLKELLLAAKWLGNDGSHGEDLKKEDVNTLYDILEYALHEAFDYKKDLILAKARAINASKMKP